MKNKGILKQFRNNILLIFLLGTIFGAAIVLFQFYGVTFENITGFSIYPPTQGTPILNSTSGNNYTIDNLTCWANATDGDGDNLTYSGEWYKGGSVFVGEYWNKDYDFTGHDTGRGLVVDSAGNVHIMGLTNGTGSRDCFTIKYDSNGNEIWNATYDSGAWDCAYSKGGIDIDSAGDVYVTGETAIDFLTIKYNGTDGSEIWNVTYDGGSNDVSNDLVVDSEGNVYVTGYSRLGGDADIFTIKYNGTDKSVLWSTPFDSGLEDFAYGVTVDSEGNVYVVGVINATGNRNYHTIKYNGTDGSEIWNVTYYTSGGSGDSAQAVAVDSQGNVYVTGQAKISISPASYLTIKYNGTDGSEIWNTTLSGTTGAMAKDIVIDSTDNVYVTGYAYTSGKRNYHTIKYNSIDGSKIWDKIYNSGATDDGSGIDLDSLGNIYVTGSANITGYRKFHTIKYKDGFIKENQIQGVLVNVGFLESNFTSVGDNWRCKVRAYDGQNYSNYNMSNTLTIMPPPYCDYEINSCQEINDSGKTYCLNTSVSISLGSDCINIDNSSIILDCQGYTITTTSSIDGISSTGQGNLTIKNCIIKNANYGITFFSANSTIINNTIINSSTGMGIGSSNAYYNLIINNTISNNSYGIFSCCFTYNNTFESNVIYNNSGNGFDLYEIGNSTFVSNTVYNNLGMYLDPAALDNLIYNNFFNNTNNVSDQGNNSWNTTLNCTSGFNIIGGNCTGGNFFATTSGNGFSENCTDVGSDGICDSSYSIPSGSNVDYLPLAIVVICGDNKVGPGEECDGTNLSGKTCITKGFDAGTLTCNASCKFNLSGCYNTGGGGGKAKKTEVEIQVSSEKKIYDQNETVTLDKIKSIINNTRSHSISGSLNMKVQKLVDDVWWVDFIDIVKNSPLTIQKNTTASLADIWEDNGNFSTDEIGKFRVHAEFIFEEEYVYEEETISDWVEFEIREEEEEIDEEEEEEEEEPEEDEDARKRIGIIPELEEQECTDSDDMINYYTKGGAIGTVKNLDSPVIIGTGEDPTQAIPSDEPYSIYYDHCIDNKKLSEAYCDGNWLRFKEVDCLFGCDDGVCLANIKDHSKYSNNHAFLVSNINSNLIKELQPLVKWTENDIDYSYPLLIYDGDNANEISENLIEITKATAFDDILIEDLITELKKSNLDLVIEVINPGDYFSFWSKIFGIIYVENNPSLIQQAAKLASSLNAPLVIQGTEFDTESVFENKYVICIGNSLPERICGEYKE
ncbi:SBBP repeat-containing protein [Candidatus Woesearchaeota archaeon]|nr:SBBP repeat-containing protein [Candidatus Woesearchaeota archaeon]